MLLFTFNPGLTLNAFRTTRPWLVDKPINQTSFFVALQVEVSVSLLWSLA